jgi:hypothetical protein
VTPDAFARRQTHADIACHFGSQPVPIETLRQPLKFISQQGVIRAIHFYRFAAIAAAPQMTADGELLQEREVVARIKRKLFINRMLHGFLLSR